MQHQAQRSSCIRDSASTFTITLASKRLSPFVSIMNASNTTRNGRGVEYVPSRLSCRYDQLMVVVPACVAAMVFAAAHKSQIEEDRGQLGRRDGSERPEEPLSVVLPSGHHLIVAPEKSTMEAHTNSITRPGVRG